MKKSYLWLGCCAILFFFFFPENLEKIPMLTHDLICSECVINDYFRLGSLEEPEMEITVQKIYWVNVLRRRGVRERKKIEENKAQQRYSLS